MALNTTTTPAPAATAQKDQPTWYDWLIDLFKKLLEYNYSSYGTKKKF